MKIVSKFTSECLTFMIPGNRNSVVVPLGSGWLRERLVMGSGGDPTSVMRSRLVNNCLVMHALAMYMHVYVV